MTRSPIIVFLAATLASPVAAQSTRVTGADYDRAAKFLAQNVTGLVVGGAVNPVWLGDGRFWYRNTTLTGSEIVVIDPRTRARQTCPAQATECAGAPITAESAQNANGRGGGGGRGEAAEARRAPAARRSRCHPTANAARSFAIGISGFATSPQVKRKP
jgi:hypothetical protein